MSPNRPRKVATLAIHVVSGGSGASGRQFAESALAQFPGSRTPIVVHGNVVDPARVEEAVRAAEADGAVILHTFVDDGMRACLVRLCRERRVEAVDLMGPLLRKIARVTGRKPLGRPGLYRQDRKDYFERFDGIDFSLSHDDGSRPEDLTSADIVVVGVSRCGKTPLCMYLAVHGWKVANIPFVLGLPVPEELFQVDRRRVFGLVIDIERLLGHRKRRDQRLGRSGLSAYSNPARVVEELEAARKLYRKGGFHVIDVTDKPIESTAAEIVKVVTGARGGGLRAPVPS
jgi:regulator of PEP synthase PpsR (kinase-PPPase family)